ncbi:hypothetical protein BJ508DRAFT_303722 [Ascobolus immersus RN42]|uniref:BHLH domain-containing protein n=1 Tax=Ascobolus immersus RN42 TaxID=1160509 RepID=A0A3N4IGQ6_ASCIM|nr:hypothetical protein BJ508DRAFT_303722 [Ascobolus immersus RN42]
MEYTDSYSQFLARLDSDAENILSGSDSQASLSPLDGHSSSTSLSPDPLRFAQYDDQILGNGIDANFQIFNPDQIPVFNDQWDQLMQNDLPSSTVASPINIKAEQSPYSTSQNNNNNYNSPSTQQSVQGDMAFNNKNEYNFDFNDPFFGAGSNNNLSAQGPYCWRQPPPDMSRQQSNPLPWQQMPPPPQQVQSMHHQQQQQQQQQHQQMQALSPVQTPPPRRISEIHIKQSDSPVSSTRETSSPEASNMYEEQQRMSKKRKTSSSSDDGGSTQPGKKQPKKTAHNMIEKRYRTNLNDKIAALRDSVPSLRVMAGTSKLGDDEDEDLEGLTPAHKLNKATVLAKATEYIRHLEKRNKRLMEENDALKGRLSAFEKLATMSTMTSMQAGQQVQGGMTGDSLLSRMMVGGLAGLMVANGLGHDDPSRGLGFIPFSFEFMGANVSADAAILIIIKLVLLVASFIFVIAPRYFAASQPKTTKGGVDPHAADLSSPPSLASPLEVRRKAWLTAVQTVWVPRNSVGLEMAALGLKTAKLGARKLMGWDTYKLITGMTQDAEAARVKAWEIAVDAQLAGGDAEINHSRLLLTLVASMTTPSTAARLMLNALHIRVLFWDLSSRFDTMADNMASYYWNEARRAQEAAPQGSPEALPEHLAKLLEFDCNRVFVDKIVQRAYNLSHNHPTDRDCDGYDEGMDSVVEDFSIRSPLDALAGWFSSMNLHDALLSTIKTSEKQKEKESNKVKELLDIAIKIAPPNTSCQLRALSARAVLEYDATGKYLNEALAIFEEDFKQIANGDSQEVLLVPRTQAPPNTAVTATTDIRITLRCAMILTRLSCNDQAGAAKLLEDLPLPLSPPKSPNSSKERRFLQHLGLLGFVSSWKLFNVISKDDEMVRTSKDSVDKCAGMLRTWLGLDVFAKEAGLSKATRTRLVDNCLNVQKKIGGYSQEKNVDDGYVSGETVRG